MVRQQEGYLDGGISILYIDVTEKIKESIKDKKEEIALSGRRSGIVKKMLEEEVMKC